MADFRFKCPQCGQEIECDELWSGHQIQCPTCQKEITVPPKPDGPPHASFASAKPGQSRLSIGSSRAEAAATDRAVPPQVAALERKLAQAKAGQKSGAGKWIATGVVVILLGVGGYLGYPYAKEWKAKRDEAAKQASTNATEVAASTNAPETTPAPAPEKVLPIIPPVWTLDVEKAAIPEARANGMIAGTNFVVEDARFDKVGPAYLLRLLEGPVTAPDRGFMIYLHPNAGESVTGRTFTVSQTLRGQTLPQVVKLWKPNPRYQARQQAYSFGYAMKLELADITNGVITGKIFLAVPPETEQSVVAGVFKANTSLADATGATVVNPVVTPNPVAPPTAPTKAGQSAFDRRYGVKR